MYIYIYTYIHIILRRPQDGSFGFVRFFQAHRLLRLFGQAHPRRRWIRHMRRVMRVVLLRLPRFKRFMGRLGTTSMEINGNQWKSMEIKSNQIKFMGCLHIYGKSMEIKSNLAPQKTVFRLCSWHGFGSSPETTIGSELIDLC